MATSITVVTQEPYDWWAAEGRPEHLRPLNDLGKKMIREPYLAAQGVTIFSTGVDFEREILTVEVAAADEGKASALVRERYGDRVEVEVVAPAAWVVEDVAWECWTPGPGADQLSIWLLDSTDDSDLRPLVSESEHEVVVTLRGPRWQGASVAMALKVEKRIQLAAPLGARHVVDGATGVRRPQRPLR
jgi:hypothetical protein